MRDTIVGLVRHGAVYNPREIFYGDVYDVPLSEKGISQATNFGRAFRKTYGTPDIIVTASHLRTKQTGLYIKGSDVIPVVEDTRLNTAHTVGLAGRQYAWYKSISDVFEDGREFHYWMETKSSVAHRVFEVVDEYKNIHQGKTVLFIGSKNPFILYLFDSYFRKNGGPIPAPKQLKEQLDLNIHKGSGAILRFDEMGKMTALDLWH